MSAGVGFAKLQKHTAKRKRKKLMRLFKEKGILILLINILTTRDTEKQLMSILKTNLRR